MRTVLSVTMAGAFLAASFVPAPSEPSGPALETEIRPRRLVVRPPLDHERARRDAARAASRAADHELQGPEAIARDLDAADLRRPDTGYDVRQAIQQRGLSRVGPAGQSRR